MEPEKQKLFNAALFPELANDYKVKENEIEKEDNKNDSSNNIEYKDPFINSLLEDNDIIKYFNIDNKNENKHAQKKEKYFFNKKYTKTKKKKKINKLKSYNIRKGDWLCPKCNNINFSFRTRCNKCDKEK